VVIARITEIRIERVIAPPLFNGGMPSGEKRV
jgi:hypothetical protein